MFLLTLTLLVLVVTSLFYYSKRKHSYWAERGVASPPSIPFFGNFLDVAFFNPGRWRFDEKVYRKYAKNGLAGTYDFLTPVLYITEPEFVKRILVKDFDHFSDRQLFKSSNEKDRVMNDMLFTENGERWKNLRNFMTPAFTSGKMKNMFSTVCEKADALVSFCLKQSAKNSHVDLKKASGRFTIDTIAACAFGLECNSMENEDAVFPKKVEPFFDFGVYRLLKLALQNAMPSAIKYLDIELFPEEKHFFHEVAKQTLEARRKGIKRGDFLDLLIEEQASELNSSNSSRMPVLDDVTILSQSIMFILVGYDTTATTVALATKLLSEYPEAQRRLREEIKETIKENGGITYQGIMEAKYLDACIMETLRLFPPAPTLERVCIKDYHIAEKNVTVKKGNIVEVPLWSLHHDEKYWKEPEVFNPDRFMPQNKANILPYTHMPFGSGPRNCLGMRFALMEAKVALAKLILAVQMKTAKGHEKIILGNSGPFLIKPKELVLVLEPLKEN